jgi:hypothetical protein
MQIRDLQIDSTLVEYDGIYVALKDSRGGELASYRLSIDTPRGCFYSPEVGYEPCFFIPQDTPERESTIQYFYERAGIKRLFHHRMDPINCRGLNSDQIILAIKVGLIVHYRIPISRATRYSIVNEIGSIGLHRTPTFCDKYFLLSIIPSFPTVLQYLPLSFQNDYDLFAIGTQIEPMMLQFAGEEIKRDPSIILEAMRKYLGVLSFASDDLISDSSFKEAAARIIFLNPGKFDEFCDLRRRRWFEEYFEASLDYADDKIGFIQSLNISLTNSSLIVRFLQNRLHLLESVAAENLNGTFLGIVQELIYQSVEPGSLNAHFSAPIKNHPAIMGAFVVKFPSEIERVSQEVLYNKTFFDLVIQHFSMEEILRYYPRITSLLFPELIRQCLQKTVENRSRFFYIPERLQDDLEFVKEFVLFAFRSRDERLSERIFEMLHPRYANDLEFILSLIKEEPAIYGVLKRLTSSQENLGRFICDAVLTNTDVIDHLTDRELEEFSEEIDQLFLINPAFCTRRTSVIHFPTFLINVFSKQPRLYQLSKYPHKNGWAFLEELLKKNLQIWSCLENGLNEDADFILYLLRRGIDLLTFQVISFPLHQPILFKIIEKDPTNLRLFPEEMLRNSAFVEVVLRRFPLSLPQFSEDFLFSEEFLEIMTVLLQERPELLTLVSKERKPYGLIIDYLMVHRRVYPNSLGYFSDLIDLRGPYLIEGDAFLVLPFPRPITRVLQSLDVSDNHCSWQRLLNEKVRDYVLSLSPQEQLSFLPVLNRAITRIETMEPFIGTPSLVRGREELEIFYEQIKQTLARIDRKIDADPIEDVEEKRQILQTLDVCGGGWQAQFEQMDAMLNDYTDETTLYDLLGRWISSFGKKVIERLNSTFNRRFLNVHRTNAMKKQLQRFLGESFTTDPFAMHIDQLKLERGFFYQFTAKAICEGIADEFRLNDGFRLRFIEYFEREMPARLESDETSEEAFTQEQLEIDALLRPQGATGSSLFQQDQEFVATLARELQELNEEEREQFLSTFNRPYSSPAFLETLLRRMIKRVDEEGRERYLLSPERLSEMIERRNEIKECLQRRVRLHQLTKIPLKEIFACEPSRIHREFLEKRGQRAREIRLEAFQERYFEDGLIKPKGVALILKLFRLISDVTFFRQIATR